MQRKKSPSKKLRGKRMTCTSLVNYFPTCSDRIYFSSICTRETPFETPVYEATFEKRFTLKGRKLLRWVRSVFAGYYHIKRAYADRTDICNCEEPKGVFV